jgi:hypothetical protein
MQTLLIVLLSLVLLYVTTVGAVLAVSFFVLKQKLRKYQDNGRFGY